MVERSQGVRGKRWCQICGWAGCFGPGRGGDEPPRPVRALVCKIVQTLRRAFCRRKVGRTCQKAYTVPRRCCGSVRRWLATRKWLSIRRRGSARRAPARESGSAPPTARRSSQKRVCRSARTISVCSVDYVSCCTSRTDFGAAKNRSTRTPIGG